MCGITGAFAFTEPGKEKLHFTKNATASLIKRGPDSEGLFSNENISLGHRRLSIIDTSVNGAQPMSDNSGRYTIVFNGEIFNYKELKKQLLAKGIAFSSESDTEVLLQLFINEGEKCFTKLDGEFAFAIYDNAEKTLTLCRDRYGIKPLYYYVNEDNYIFASEMKAIQQYNCNFSIDISSLQTYLHLNYIPSPQTIYNEVKKVKAGHYIKVEGNKTITDKAYYEPALASPPDISYESAKLKLRELLTSSVQNRMIADVPLGSFLSGGIDSSIIAALASQQTKHLNTFSIGFKDEPYFDETKYAYAVAKKINTEHTVFSLTNDDLYANLNSVLDYIDEPFADSSALAVYILSHYTRKHVTVALSGDGADELFGGYNKHTASLFSLKKGLPNQLLKHTSFLWDVLPKSRNSNIGNKLRQASKLSEGLNLGNKERYWRWAGFSDNKTNNPLLLNSTDYEQEKQEIVKYITHDFNSWLLTDIKLVLENDMLVKVDRMSMANSLEVRVPFLDHKLVDFSLQLPVSFKISGKNRKRILKDTFADLLPPEILNRGKKGFEVPLLKWFRNELKPAIENIYLEDNFIREQKIFNPAYISQLKKQLFSSSPNDAAARTWAIIVFQHWWKKNGLSEKNIKR